MVNGALSCRRAVLRLRRDAVCLLGRNEKRKGGGLCRSRAGSRLLAAALGLFAGQWGAVVKARLIGHAP